MWEILFYKSPHNPTATGKCSIFPANVGWNDFGYNYQAILRLHWNNQIEQVTLRLLPINADEIQPNFSSWVRYLSSTPIEQRDQNQRFPYYVSVLSNPDEYKLLAAKLGEHYEEFLSEIGELNACYKLGEISSEIYQEIITSPQFRLGVLRQSGPYKSFRFGYFQAKRLDPPDDARIPFRFSAQLSGFDGPHVLNFQYLDTPLLADRVQCLIGVNGIGKTRLLKSLTSAILAKINSLRPDYQSALYDSKGRNIADDPDVTNLPEESWQTLPPFSRVISYSSDSNNTLPRSVSLDGSFDYRYFDMGVEEQNSKLSVMLIDIIRNDSEFVEDSNRYTVLKKILQTVVPLNRLLIPVLDELDDNAAIVDTDGYKWIPIGVLRGEQRKLEIMGMIDSGRDLAFNSDDLFTMPLSSGQRLYFKFATHFLTNVDTGSLVIIDEPETHLHPNLVTEFMNLLYLVLEATNSVAIIATHSAYVVRETPSHCVQILRNDPLTGVKTERVYLNTLGANISELSDFVFGDSTVTAFHKKIAKRLATSNASLDQIINEYKSIVSLDMLIEIRELIESEKDSDRF
ncbi:MULTISPECIES: AAA family ATPase [Stutzerimonas stutzeri subgroup]|uniref:AAA family ATPase n=1 Tax=Stutzerimonas stutzeri subgroup TaxID=578833 RepID=UPI0028996C81|nr:MULTISPECIES: AAA family ATPase [Stutzerimonas stutzeri subgroup]